MKNAPKSSLRIAVWIDHRVAVLVNMSEKQPRAKHILSRVEKQLRREGNSPQDEKFESQLVPADDSRERRYTGHLSRFYQEVVNEILEADAILIFGPGEAKGELKKELDRHDRGSRVVCLESAAKMSDHQFVRQVMIRALFAVPAGMRNQGAIRHHLRQRLPRQFLKVLHRAA